jgi:uncharacterized protein with HEPN domain
MLDTAREARSLAAGRSSGDLENDRVFFLALTRLLEILGEAARRIPQEVRGRYPGLRWKGITGMRDWIAHGCDELDLDVIWDAVTHDLDPLIERLERIVAELPAASD